MDDAELVARLRLRDTAALSALVEECATPVYRLIRRILAGAGTEQDVEECASDAFHTAWRKIEQYDPTRASLLTWLLILAKYQALERRRKAAAVGQAPYRDVQSATPPEAPAVSTPEQALAQSERRREIQAALDQLPPLDRELVYRRYFLEERVDRLAEALGLTRQAADNRLWRARKALRAILREEAINCGGGA